jgi:hypothetical protein
MEKRQSKKWWGLLTVLTLVGTYNAIVLNTKSEVSKSEVPVIKTLDEMYGIYTPGREVAAKKWQKLETEKIKNTHTAEVKIQESQSEEKIAEAAIKHSLYLQLVEVVNPKKWKTAPTRADFSGNLATNDGILDDFTVYLPSGDEISVAYIEMNGNVFNYDLDGEIYNAMIFQADQHSYIVTLNNGPLEGTRMRFRPELNEEQVAISQTLHENHNVEVGNFGDEVSVRQSVTAYADVEPNLEAQSFKF